MEVRKTLKPGDHGTKQLHEIYGDKLFCVRYRYDDKNSKRYTSVELIVDEKPFIKNARILHESSGTYINMSTVTEDKKCRRDMESRQKAMEIRL